MKINNKHILDLTAIVSSQGSYYFLYRNSLKQKRASCCGWRLQQEYVYVWTRNHTLCEMLQTSVSLPSQHSESVKEALEDLFEFCQLQYNINFSRSSLCISLLLTFNQDFSLSIFDLSIIMLVTFIPGVRRFITCKSNRSTCKTSTKI